MRTAEGDKKISIIYHFYLNVPAVCLLARRVTYALPPHQSQYAYAHQIVMPVSSHRIRVQRITMSVCKKRRSPCVHTALNGEPALGPTRFMHINLPKAITV